MAEKITIFLAPAFRWSCECGQENFVTSNIVEFTPDESQAMVDSYGGESKDYQTGNWLNAPETVTCSKCEIEFEVSGSWID